MKIQYTLPVTKNPGNCTIVGTSSWCETARENALWTYNNMRARDGLPPVADLPDGTTLKFIPPKEFKDARPTE